jgi:hypothetical protein
MDVVLIPYANAIWFHEPSGASMLGFVTSLFLPGFTECTLLRFFACEGGDSGVFILRPYG